MSSANDPRKDERECRIARRIAAKFGRDECDACAAGIIKALGRGSGARVLRILPGDGSSYIGLVETLSLISNNRIHIGIRVGDRAFDNLHPEGVPIEEWPRRFLSRTGAPLIIEERPVADFFGARFRREQFRDWVYRV